MEKELTPIYWAESSKSELLAFPDHAMQDAGYQLRSWGQVAHCTFETIVCAVCDLTLISPDHGYCR